MKPANWHDIKARLEAGALNEDNTPMFRINCLTELYFLHQFDVHSQARYVRRIQDLARVIR